MHYIILFLPAVAALRLGQENKIPALETDISKMDAGCRARAILRQAEAGLEKEYMYWASGDLALSQMESFFATEKPLAPSSDQATICVGIMSARRKKSPIKYLEQTVAALIARANEPKNVYIRVFNVDEDPEHHEEAHRVASLVDVVTLKNHNHKYENTFKQEIGDYADALRAMHAMEHCETPLIIEDDALPVDGWDAKVREVQNELKTVGNWGTVKLYSSDHSQTEGGLRLSSDAKEHLVRFDGGYNMVVVLFDRKTMLQFADAFDQKLEEWINSGQEGEFKDHLLSSVSRSNSLPILAVDPVIFQHVGVYSSLERNETPQDRAKDFVLHSNRFRDEGKPILFDTAKWPQIAERVKTTKTGFKLLDWFTIQALIVI